MHIATPTPDGDLHPPEMQFSYKEIRAAAELEGRQARFDEPFPAIDVGAEFTLWLYEYGKREVRADDTKSSQALRVKVTGGLRFDPAGFPSGLIDEVFKVFEATVLRQTIGGVETMTAVCGVLYANTKKYAVIVNATDKDFVRESLWMTPNAGSNG